MKRLIISIFFIGLLISASVTYTADALTAEYMRIITADTPFYSDADGEELLFYLPYTYYVKVIERGETLSHVECFGTGETPLIDGYTPTVALFSDGLEVSNPYADVTISTITTTVLYADKSFESAVCYVFPGRSLRYYGHVTDASGKFYYFVSYNNRLGYVCEEAVEPFTVPNHPNELTFIPTERPEEPLQDVTQNANDDFFSLKIAVIVCLAFAGLTALFIVVKKREKHSVAASYYDENDYE